MAKKTERMMIKINDRFTIERDTYGWNLYETRMGEDAEGNPKEQIERTYPGKLWVAFSCVIEACGDEAGTLTELREMILNTVGEFREATKHVR